MARILAIADEVSEALYGEALHRLRPDLILSCGDLDPEYLENLVTRAAVPLLYVPGNHDAYTTRTGQPGGAWLTPAPDDRPPGPEGCESVDGRVLEAAGLRVAGLGGSVRYKPGPNQYTQREMRWRALRLEAGVRLRHALTGRGVDVLVTHAPPLGAGDAPDPAHQGFAAFHRLVRELRPRLLLHGHVHPVQRRAAQNVLGGTPVVNVIPYRLLDL